MNLQVINMLRRKIEDNQIDTKNLNEVILLLKKILKFSYILIIIAAIVGVTMISKEWNIKGFLFTFLKVLSPLFIGFVVAWLFNPFVTWLQKKGVRRSIGAIITYLILFGIIFIILNAIIPMLFDQINDFVKTMPSIMNSISGWLDDVVDKFKNIEYINVESVRIQLLDYVKNFGMSMTKQLPEFTIDVLKHLFSGLGVIVVGLIIGFYLLLTFHHFGDTFTGFIPKRFKQNTEDLIALINSSMIRYVQGAMLDCTCIFIITTIGLWMVGLKAPLLFGLFCGITNVIPYAGPYIGGFPAVIVAFSQSTTTGILVLIVIAVIQFVEGNFFQPYIMSKTTKLHPVTIILGLLVFGHFWGILGMVASTPIIGSIKAILIFMDRKYGYFGFSENEDKRKAEAALGLEN